MRRDSQVRAWIWLAIFAAFAVGLFVVAVSNAAYEATSPSWLSFHVLLRKSYSVVAFALVGFALSQAMRFAGVRLDVISVGLSVGLYSALIELGQRFLAGARESLAQQSFDVACGFLGGVLAALVAQIVVRHASRRR